MLDGTKAAIVKLRDGLENLVSGLGTNIDKRRGTRFVNSKVADSELISMYRYDWASAKVVDIIPSDCTRNWRSFTGGDDLGPEVIEELENEEKRLGLCDAFRTAHKWSRLLGSSIIVLNVSNSGSPHEPLDLSKPNMRLRHIKVFDKTKVTPSIDIIDDPMSESWGLPLYYMIHGSTVKIHHSRVIRFDAVDLPYDEMRRNNFWADSILQKLSGSILNFNIVAEHAAGLVFESNVDVVKVPNLMGQISSPQGEAALRKRFSLAKSLKSSQRIMLMDAQEEYDTKNQAFSGLPDLLDRYLGVISAATDIPATRLLGTSASGLNSTGEGDMKNYYDMLSSVQRVMYDSALSRVDALMAMNIGADPESISYEWTSLFQLTDVEVANLENSRADRDGKYYDMGVLGSLEIAKELKQMGTYTNIDEVIEFLEEADKMSSDDLGGDDLGDDPEIEEGDVDNGNTNS